MNKVDKVAMTTAGVEFSQLVQGYWRLDQWAMTPQQRLAFLQQHIELGITTVDHAHVYGPPSSSCESLFGQALSINPSVRQQIQIISKFGIELVGDNNLGQVNHYLSTKQAMIASVETSLSRLNVEHIDVLLVHRPDFLMDADDIADTFATLRQSGKVGYLGVSNFTPSQFSLLQSRLDSPLVTNQVEINPLNFAVCEDGSLDQLQQHRVRPMAWSCLAGGQIFNGSSQQLTRVRDTLTQLMEEIGADSIEQVIYAWVLHLPSKPLPIIGSGQVERLQSAVKALDLRLTSEQWYRVWVASKGHGVP